MPPAPAFTWCCGEGANPVQGTQRPDLLLPAGLVPSMPQPRLPLDCRDLLVRAQDARPLIAKTFHRHPRHRSAVRSNATSARTVKGRLIPAGANPTQQLYTHLVTGRRPDGNYMD